MTQRVLPAYEGLAEDQLRRMLSAEPHCEVTQLLRSTVRAQIAAKGAYVRGVDDAGPRRYVRRRDVVVNC